MPDDGARGMHRMDEDAGYTIIEVLVAILVLALGLIGGAAMQLTALRTRHQSALLSHAVQLASGMADRMRLNAAQMRLDDAGNPYLNQHYDSAVDGEPAPPGQLCLGASACDEAQLARFDLYELKQQLHRVLPGGRLAICRDTRLWDKGRKGYGWSCSGAADAPVVIKLGWRGKNPDGSPAIDVTREYTPGVVLALAGEAK